jgi:hypothetical protein
MATTDVVICSNALLLVGDDPINSLAETSKRAKIAANLYPQMKKALLRAGAWNCAVTRVALAPDATAPVFDYTYAFPLPSDCLRVLQIGQTGSEPDHRVEGRKVLSDDNPCYLRYVREISEGDFDEQLAHTLTLIMAAAMAYPLTKSAAFAKEMADKASRAVREAMAIDGVENPGELLGDFPLLRAGYIGTFSGSETF